MIDNNDTKVYIQYYFLPHGLSENTSIMTLICFDLQILSFGEYGHYIGAFSKN